MKIELHECDRCERKIEYPNESVWNIPLSISAEKDYGREGTSEICALCLEALRAVYAVRPIPAYLQGVLDNEARLEKERKQE